MLVYYNKYFTFTVFTGIKGLKKRRSYIGVVGLAATIRKELACIEDEENDGAFGQDEPS